MKRFTTALVLLAAVSIAQAETYTIDAGHSSVGFKVKHLVGKVAGHFDKYSGTVNFDPAKPESLSAEATIDATSINTGIEKRDKHLNSPEYFDTAKFPTLTFKSTKATVQGGKTLLEGNLTMHGVTKPVVLEVETSGPVADPFGGARVGASATTKVNRNDFGVGPTTGMGASMVGKDIEISIEIEAASATKKK